MEATADPELVLVFYDQLLDADSSNFVRRLLRVFPPFSISHLCLNTPSVLASSLGNMAA